MEEGSLLVYVLGCAIICRQHGLCVCVERNDRHAILWPELFAHVAKAVFCNIQFCATVWVVWKAAAHAATGMRPIRHS
jgi:hypothetical protein